MDESQFETFILEPALQVVNLYSPATHILILGTFLVESGLTFVEQKGPGDAMGFGQVEDVTYNDILRYLNRFDKAALKEKCLAACFYTAFPPRSSLMHNLRWAVIVARLKYLPVRQPLPKWDDAMGLAQYHKLWYNTPRGKTDVKESVKIFERIISERRHRFEGQS